MPRQVRLYYPGGIYHVNSRFVNGNYCLDEPGGREKYLGFLGAAVKRSLADHPIRVVEGRGERRRKDLNGEKQDRATRRFEFAFGDSWRLSGPIVGSDQFAARTSYQPQKGLKMSECQDRPPTD